MIAGCELVADLALVAVAKDKLADAGSNRHCDPDHQCQMPGSGTSDSHWLCATFGPTAGSRCAKRFRPRCRRATTWQEGDRCERGGNLRDTRPRIHVKLECRDSEFLAQSKLRIISALTSRSANRKTMSHSESTFNPLKRAAITFQLYIVKRQMPRAYRG
jgi:hypothetical protein